MHLKKIAFNVFLLCSFAATVTAQNQSIEKGSADELNGRENSRQRPCAAFDEL